MINLRDLVKLKKIQKSEKTRIGQTPPPLSIFFIFLEKIWKHENNTKNTKNTKFQKKIRVGLKPPTHGFFYFFNLTKPLSVLLILYHNSIFNHYNAMRD